MDSSPEDADHALTVWNTETDLQALFDSVLTPSTNHPQQVPWSMRNLPDSFFNPPTTGSKSVHSRDNSTDSGAFTSSGIFTSPPLNSIPLQTVHHRAHSSPAKLQENPNSRQEISCHQHMKQRSHDVMSSTSNTSLPFGWEEAVTPEGQLYYLNHITKTTTWEDPRKFLNVENYNQYQIFGTSNTTSEPNADVLGSLPDGWEQSITPEGETYFINHSTRSTSWFDPRIPTHLQQIRSEVLAAPWYSTHIKEQDMRLHLLHLEREKLKQRREELRKQQVLSNFMINQVPSELIDHSRQESTDSATGESLKDWNSIEVTLSAVSSSFDLVTDNYLCPFNNTLGNGNHSIGLPNLPDLDNNLESSDDFGPSLELQQQYSVQRL